MGFRSLEQAGAPNCAGSGVRKRQAQEEGAGLEASLDTAQDRLAKLRE